MSTYLSGKELTQAIVDQWREVKDYMQRARLAKKDFAKAVEKTPEAQEVTRLSEQLANAKEKLKSKILNDAELGDLSADVAYYNTAVSSAKVTLSDLLVRQAVTSKNASTDLGEDGRHEIILKAVLGREAPEQMPLFDGDTMLEDSEAPA
jgi:hypothetical protein